MILLKFSFSHSGPSHWAFLIILLIFITITSFVFWLTRGFVFKYRDRIKVNDISVIFTGIHLVFSLLTALFLPNNYLINYSYFKEMFHKNTLIIPFSIIVIFIINIVILGLTFNFLTYIITSIFNKQKN